MIKLAESSGTVIYEGGNKLFISKRPAMWTSVFLFVTGLLTFILLVNGIIQLVVVKNQADSSSIGIVLMLIAIFFAAVFWRVWLYRKKVNIIPPDQLKNIVILDFENNKLLDYQQNILCSLSQAWLMRKMQLSSSSPELILYWDSGSVSIVKGNPFSGGIAPIEKLLLSKGIRRK